MENPLDLQLEKMLYVFSIFPYRCPMMSLSQPGLIPPKLVLDHRKIWILKFSPRIHWIFMAGWEIHKDFNADFPSSMDHPVPTISSGPSSTRQPPLRRCESRKQASGHLPWRPSTLAVDSNGEGLNWGPQPVILEEYCGFNMVLYPSIYLSIHPSIHPSIHLYGVYLYVYIHIMLGVYSGPFLKGSAAHAAGWILKNIWDRKT